MVDRIDIDNFTKEVAAAGNALSLVPRLAFKAAVLGLELLLDIKTCMHAKIFQDAPAKSYQDESARFKAPNPCICSFCGDSFTAKADKFCGCRHPDVGGDGVIYYCDKHIANHLRS